MVERTISLISIVIILTIASAVAGAGCSREAEVDTENNGKIITARQIPSIDKAVPAELETATFAMG